MTMTGGEMCIINCCELMMEIFASVGYDKIMHIEAKTESNEV